MAGTSALDAWRARLELHGALAAGRHVRSPRMSPGAAADCARRLSDRRPGAPLVRSAAAVERRSAAAPRSAAMPRPGRGGRRCVDALVGDGGSCGTAIASGRRTRRPPGRRAGSGPRGGHGPARGRARGRRAAAAQRRGARPAARRPVSARSSASGRIVVLEPDLAYAASTYRELAAQRARDAGRGAADAGRAPRRDRHEPQVRHGHPRGPRPAGDPAPHAGRPCARAEGAARGRRPTR